MLIAVITALALSVLRGLDGGIKLDEANILTAASLGLFVLLTTPILTTLSNILTSGWSLFVLLPTKHLVRKNNFYYMHDWTTFYWAWWIAFSPFVGLFIARISRRAAARVHSRRALIAVVHFLDLDDDIRSDRDDELFYDGATAVATAWNFSELTLFIFLEQLPLSR